MVKMIVQLRNLIIYRWYDILAYLRESEFSWDPDSTFVTSIASYPARSHLLPAVFESIGRQAVLPRLAYLVLSEEEWPEKKLSNRLVKLQKLGVKIVWTTGNPYSVKMLLPILVIQKDLSIITLGDDWIYGKRFLENTVNSKPAQDGFITGPLGKSLYRDGDDLNMQYRDNGAADMATPSEQVYLFGLGTIYPPNSLHEKVSNLEAVKKIVPGRGSDVWFWAAAKAKGTKQVCLGKDSIRNKVIPIPENNKTEPKDRPGKEEMNRRFQQSIDYFEIREKLLRELPNFGGKA